MNRLDFYVSMITLCMSVFHTYIIYHHNRRLDYHADCLDDNRVYKRDDF